MIQALKQFVLQNGLTPADAIVLRKKFFGMVDHFAVFLGWDKKNPDLPVFAANYTKGTKYIQPHELNHFLTELAPERIEKFEGTDQERKLAVKRAMSKIGEENYSYFSNNCEHYKSFVQTGIPKSKQVEDVSNAVLTGVGSILLVALLKEIFD